MRLTQGGVGHELGDQGRHVDTPVKTVAKGGEVGAGIFGVLQGVIRASQTGLQIAQHRVDPFELRQVSQLARADDVDFVGAIGRGDRAEAGQPSDKTLQPSAKFLTAQSLIATKLNPSTSES